MQEKQDQKVVFVSLSIHTNFEHEECTQKNKKPKPPLPLSLWKMENPRNPRIEGLNLNLLN